MADIIKCKDCKYFNAWRTLEGAEKHGQIYECSKLVITSPSPDEYCSKAEAKEKIIKDLQENQELLPIGRYGGI